MMVRYDRSKIARYGLNISDLKRYDRSWICRKTVGNVFEGENV
jgi:cobalt-zinc-cadmium resistance protein CzcA